jgi:predicted ATPase
MAAVLLTLVERASDVVTKEELLQIVWPSMYVDEGNLKVQVAALRKILGDDPEKPQFISSVVGRGYRFVARVQRIDLTDTFPERRSALSTSNVPAPLSRMHGRAQAISEISGLVRSRRLVSIVGPGGIGKTTIALAVIHTLLDEFEDGIHFIDLAAVTSEALVPFAVASAFKVSVETDNPLASLISFLIDRKLMIVFDNCEHVIETVAPLVETLLKGIHGLHVLATSHEALRTEGEWLHRLGPLEIPGDRIRTLADAMRYPAVELFVERATSGDQALGFDDYDVPFIVDICRKLDGIPLAIEIAAARVEVFGISGLADRLEDRLDLLTSGRRTAVDRHQTIRKMLDWSHENLGRSEQVLLRRLSIFAGPFGLSAAMMIAGDETLTSGAISEGISSLVRKSLLHPKASARTVTYRLLESTRIYATEKLGDAGELDRMCWLHGQYCIDMLTRAELDWPDTVRSEWLQRHAPVLDDVRHAVSWAFSETGNKAIGVRLTALALPLGMQLGLVDEFRERNDIAIAHAASLPVPELVAEMRLNLFHAYLNTNQSEPVDGSATGVKRAVELAQVRGRAENIIQPKFLLAGFNMGMANYVAALAHAETVGDIAGRMGDPLATLASQRMLAQTTHFAGFHERSIALTERVLAHPSINIPLAFGGVQTDRRVSMRIVRARSLWMQGFADQAVEVMNEAVAIAPEDGPAALCQALSQAACPIYLWRGETGPVSGHVDLLIAEATRYTLNHWRSWGDMYLEVLAEAKGVPAVPKATQGKLQTHTLATIRGQLANIDLCDRDLVANTGWAAPEILRLHAEQLAATDIAAAEHVLLRGSEVALGQGALAWDLRIAISLARLGQKNGRIAQYLATLESAYQRFSEGLETRDLIQARQLLEDLSRM